MRDHLRDELQGQLTRIRPGKEVLNQACCLELRKIMHEMSSITTGMLLSAGLLSEALRPDSRCRYSEQIREAGERSAALVREARALLYRAQDYRAEEYRVSENPQCGLEP